MAWCPRRLEWTPSRAVSMWCWAVSGNTSTGEAGQTNEGSRGQSKGCGHSGCRSPAHRALVPPSGRLWAAWPPNTASAALSGTFTLCSGPAPANCRVPAHRVCQHGARQKAKGVHCTGVQHHKSACKCPIPPLHHHSIHPPAPAVTPTMHCGWACLLLLPSPLPPLSPPLLLPCHNRWSSLLSNGQCRTLRSSARSAGPPRLSRWVQQT